MLWWGLNELIYEKDQVHSKCFVSKCVTAVTIITYDTTRPLGFFRPKLTWWENASKVTGHALG